MDHAETNKQSINFTPFIYETDCLVSSTLQKPILRVARHGHVKRSELANYHPQLLLLISHRPRGFHLIIIFIYSRLDLLLLLILTVKKDNRNFNLLGAVQFYFMAQLKLFPRFRCEWKLQFSSLIKSTASLGEIVILLCVYLFLPPHFLLLTTVAVICH